MSRAHSSRPSKSKPLSTPVPVITQTLLPSVTGEGEAMLCLRIIMLPPPSLRFHSTAPFARSTHQRLSSSPSATLRKTRSPHTMGVEPLRSGIASFHATFSAAVHFTGRFRSALTPFRSGPRHCGQLAETVAVNNTTRHVAGNSLRILNSSSGGLGQILLPFSVGCKSEYINHRDAHFNFRFEILIPP